MKQRKISYMGDPDKMDYIESRKGIKEYNVVLDAYLLGIGEAHQKINKRIKSRQSKFVVMKRHSKKLWDSYSYYIILAITVIAFSLFLLLPLLVQ